MVPAAEDGRAGIDAALVKRLIAAQFPHWSGLPVTPVEVDGWDNRTYRLGEDMTVRLPTAAGYVPAVAQGERLVAPAGTVAAGRRATDPCQGRPWQGVPLPVVRARVVAWSDG